MRELSTAWRTGAAIAPREAARLLSFARLQVGRPFLRKFATLASLTAGGLLSFVLALPLLTRMYAPVDFGAFVIYLAAVNLAGPLLSLKFDSSLYACASRRRAAQNLGLALATLGVMSALGACAVWSLHGVIVRDLGAPGAAIVYLLPVGMLLSGAWSVSSAWAVRAGASTTLGIARLLQPLLMTVLQLAAGAVSPSATTLLVAHLISHAVYSSFIAGRELTRADLAAMRALSLRRLLCLARRNRKFPLFSLPAQVSSLTVSNLPPILLSAFYGAELAGYFGIAYRLVAVPLTIASMPLGALLVSSLLRMGGGADRGRLVRKVFVFNLALVGAPVLLLGALAGPLAPLALGANWATTGQVVAALSLLGAAQALATPFAEATSIVSAQHLRFAIDGATALFVVGSLIVCGWRGTEPLQAIWTMSMGGALLSLAGLAVVIGRISDASALLR